MSFSKLNPEDIVISNDSVASTLFSNGQSGLALFFTSSTQFNGSSSYYLDVYNTGSNISGSSVQFDIAYGHQQGSGSMALNSIIPYNSPSRATFLQYQNLLFGDEGLNFNFGPGNTSSFDIFAIPISRARYKEKLFLSTFTLYLNGTQEIVLTNDSQTTNTVNFCDAGRIYNIISGSSGVATTATFPGITTGYTPSGSYGYFLPDIGTLILNPRALALPSVSGGIGLSITTTSNTATSNIMNLYYAISGSGANHSNGSFFLNSEETLTSMFAFVRVKNAEFNYTTNPSLISGSGDFIYSNFINNPQTYPTTIGLYNDQGELLAVSKLSKPVTKDFTKELLLTMRLQF